MWKKSTPKSVWKNQLLFLICLIFCSCSIEEKQDKRPNILFILSDDHTSQAWGIYGGILADYVKNDHIKRLAEEGTTLDNAFCTNSICTPSRASIMTGQYSHLNGVYTLSEALEPDSNNVAKVLQSGGYETAVIGKWHLKKEPTGFDYYAVLPGQGRYHNPILKTKENWQDHGKGGKEYKGFSADVIGDLSINWLKNRVEDKPFFLMTQFKATHEPFDYPERHKALNENVDLPEPASLLDFSPTENNRSFIGQKLWRLGERWVNDSKNLAEGKPTRYPGLPFTLEGLDSIAQRKKIYQKFVKDFIRSGAAIDDNIGKLLNYLDENNLAENTIVIYTADQGYFLGEHGFFDKRMMYEEALRMPFVIRYPKEIPAGKRLDDMILNIDFPALFIDYAEVEPLPKSQGHSFRTNLQGQTPKDWRKSMYYRYWLHQTVRPAHLGIRTDFHKLIFYYGQPLGLPGAQSETTEPVWELYDLTKDPEENYNVYGTPMYEQIEENLKKELLKIKKEVGDTIENDLMNRIFVEHWN